MSLQFNNTNATLNNMVAIFKEIASDHAQINHFGFGEEYDIEANTVKQYPFLWVYTLPATLNESWISYNFRLIMMDLAEANISNQTEVQSDAILVLTDVLYSLRDNYDFDIQFGYQATPFTEKYTDRVSGWFIDVKIDVPRTFGACDIPLKNVNPIDLSVYLVDSDNGDLLDSDNAKLITA